MLEDRHVVVFVGEQEVCRGGVPAPAPPTEVSSWSSDLWSSDAAAAAISAAGGDGGGSGGSSSGGGGKGGSGRGRVLEVRVFVAGQSFGEIIVHGLPAWYFDHVLPLPQVVVERPPPLCSLYLFLLGFLLVHAT